MDIDNFTIKAPAIPCLHRCKRCGSRLTNERKDEIVAYEEHLWEDGASYIYFCDEVCAKDYYKKFNERLEKRRLDEEDLRNYIKK